MKSSAGELSPGAVDRLAEVVRSQHEAQKPVHAGYEIQCLLAQGGMGAVFLALERKLHRQVAMKVVNAQDEGLLDRFHREAVSTANLQHPNILPVFDYGTLEDGRLFYTMKLIEGRSLKGLDRSVSRFGGPAYGPANPAPNSLPGMRSRQLCPYEGRHPS